MLDEIEKDVISLPGKASEKGNIKKQMEVEQCLTIAGTDVESLFPSLQDVEVARIARQAVVESGIKFQNIDYDAALKYIFVTGGVSHIKEIGLQSVAPKWTGSRPDLLTVGGDCLEENDKWCNTGRELMDWQKVRVIGRVIETAVLVCMGTHPYCFGDKLLLQQDSPPALLAW